MSIQSTIHTNQVADNNQIDLNQIDLNQVDINQVDNKRNQLFLSKLAAIVAAIALLAAFYSAGSTASEPTVVENDPAATITPAAGVPHYYSTPGSSLDTENSFSW